MAHTAELQANLHTRMRTVVDDPAAVRSPAGGEADVADVVRKRVGPLQELVLVWCRPVTHANNTVQP